MDFKKLSTLAIEANGKKGHIVFCDFAGHVDAISIRISESKENWNNKLYDSGTIYADPFLRCEKTYHEAFNILERLVNGERVFDTSQNEL